jgi:hypothetical protein
MSGGFNAKVVFPNAFKVQTKSGGFQKPFMFGGAQTPTALQLNPDSYSGASGSGLHKKPTAQLHKIKLFLPK